MKKFIVSLLIVLLCLTSNAQTKQYDVGNLTFETFVPNNYYKRFHNPSELPPLVSDLISSEVKAKTGKYYKNFTLKYCDIIEVKKFLQDYPDSINQLFLPIPRYRAVFNWCDSTLGVKSYLFQALMDEYGQLIYLGFPRTDEPEQNNFMTCDKANEMADSIVAPSITTYDEQDTYLYYNILVNDLKWIITYSKYNYRKEDDKTFSLFRILTFSLKKHKLLRDITEENEFIYFQF
jgi:hypothetical protein